jgi:hypothetical protein
MEDQLARLGNILSNKTIEEIEIVGKVNNDGSLTQIFNNTFTFDKSFNYYVSLISLNASAFFPNVTGSNNKFYYVTPENQAKTLTLESGAYEIDDYGKYINYLIGEKSEEKIKIWVDKSTAKTMIKLATGYKIDFTKENTWRDMLGFDSVILDKPLNISPKMADILPLMQIFVHLDIIKGSNYNGKSTDILYSFPNNFAYGEAINEKPINLRPKSLLSTEFSSIQLRFTDENNKPVTFQNTPISVTLEIRQC